MRNEREPEAYLPQQEQLIVAAKVNRLCEANPETFDPETQVQDAQDIINALSPRTKPHGKFSGGISYISTYKSEAKAGATNSGNVNASFDETKIKKAEFGVEEYRIGNYVASKYTGRNTTLIIFENFWDRDMVNEAFEKNAEETRVEYDTKSLGVQKISVGVPKRRNIACLSITTYQDVPLWQKSLGKFSS